MQGLSRPLLSGKGKSWLTGLKNYLKQPITNTALAESPHAVMLLVYFVYVEIHSLTRIVFFHTPTQEKTGILKNKTTLPKLKAEVENNQDCLVTVKEITIATQQGDHSLATQIYG